MSDRHASVRVRSSALLVELRRSTDLSLRDMADRLPCGKSMLHALETGTKQTCSAVLAERIAEVLGVKCAVLFAPAPSVHRGRPSRQEDAA
jgi:hypothetical protein